MRGGSGSGGRVSWRRWLVLTGGGVAAVLGLVGLLALRRQLLGHDFYLPTWLGATLAFFGGLGMPDIAEVLSLSPRTVERDWRFIKAWLREELGESP